jgi:hypothetical protein
MTHYKVDEKQNPNRVANRLIQCAGGRRLMVFNPNTLMKKLEKTV